MAAIKAKKPTSKLKAGQKKKVNKWLIIGGVAVVAVIGVVVVRFSSAATCRSVTFRQGSQSDCVKDIQGIINYKFGYAGTSRALPVNGKFDAKTRDYVKVYQATRNPKLTADGVVGPNTWRSLCFQQGGGSSSDPLTRAYYLYRKHAGCF